MRGEYRGQVLGGGGGVKYLVRPLLNNSGMNDMMWRMTNGGNLLADKQYNIMDKVLFGSWFLYNHSLLTRYFVKRYLYLSAPCTASTNSSKLFIFSV